MNSNGIEPRVGMQVSYRGEVFKIATIYCNCLYNEDGMHEMCGSSWRFGEATIEWIPPTDGERVMFANFARDYKGLPGHEFDAIYKETYDWMLNNIPDEIGSKDRIAESLALDGMGIDDVSKIEELMR